MSERVQELIAEARRASPVVFVPAREQIISQLADALEAALPDEALYRAVIAENTRLMADAERLDWFSANSREIIRSGNVSTDLVGEPWKYAPASADPLRDKGAVWYDTLREAIDAAMRSAA